MRLLSAVLLAALTCVASGAFRGDFASIFNTWNPSEDVRLVDDFAHLTQIFHPQAHEEEIVRRKRNVDETARFAAAGSPITRACNTPGYTGQYCEFPICESFNPSSNPDQFLRDEGYVIDLTDLGNCTRVHKIIVDETMYDIHIEVQSLDNVSPQLTIMDLNGYIGTPDRITQEPDRFIAVFNSLPFGAYSVQPTASNINSRCILTTTAQTTLTISGGFQMDERDRSDFPNENAGAHQFNSILLTLNGGRSPSSLKTVSVVGPDNYVLRPRVLDKRYGCQYEFYFDSLFCYERGSYALIVDGVDFNGNLFRRVAPFQCVYQPGPSTSSAAPSTPQPTNPTSCANGGVLLESGGKTSCVCQDHWTGYDCSKALCINGGTLIEGKCFCAVGFEGVHCEQVKCEPHSNHGFGVDRPTLVFVVRARVQQKEVVQQVQAAIDEVIANLQFDPTYLARFHLTLFNDHEVFRSKSYDSIQKFDSDLFSYGFNSRDSDGECNDNVMEALATALTDVSLTQGSTVYVITDAMADDESKFADQILQMNSFWRAQINFVYIQPAPEMQCSGDLSDPGFRAFDDVANRFGGLAWNILDRTKVHDVLYGHMNSILYKSQLMLTVDRDECSKGLGKVIQLEQNTETIVFVSRGRDFHLEMTTPEGNRVLPKTIVKEGIFTVQRWASPLPGAYMIEATSDTPSAACSLRAYQASLHQLSSNPQTEAYWAMTTNVDTDAMSYQPLAGTDNHPVFNIEDFGDDVDHAFAFLNMYAVRNGLEQEVYASNGLYRGGCSFQFYFPSFRCRPNENLHYEFNLRNDYGFYLQRAGVMTCFNYIPTPAAPTDCQNGGVKYNDTCLCQSHYKGEHCETLICQNGGTNVFGSCQCPSGWTGPFCDYPQCPESGPLPTYGYHADMVFIVEVTQKGVEQIAKMLTTLPEVIRDVGSQHSDWIDRLVLIGYDSKGVVGMVDSPMSNTKKFFDTLNQWAESNPLDDNCHVQIWSALDALLNDRKDGNEKRELPERSIVNIIEASIPYYDDDLSSLVYSISEALLERRTITNVLQSDNWNDGGLKCGGKDSDFIYLEQIARRGDGMLYTVGNGDLARAIRMIPTLFSSSIVYKTHIKDCSSVGHKIYFPVDAYTQTVTAVVYGQQADVQLFKKDGRYYYPYPAEGQVKILDDFMNQIVEFRNPCENDWTPISQSCAYYDYALTKNFQDASDLCQSMGGFMVDDLNGDKTYWIGSVLNTNRGWLGLTFVNGEWVWQQDNGKTMPVPPHTAQWAGVDVPDGTTGTCAYFYMNLWHPSDCDEIYAVICQKHMFNRNNQPSNLDDDDLSPGKYYFLIETSFGGAYRGCDVEVRVQSDLKVDYGFVDGLRKDKPHPIANVDSNENLIVSTVSIGKAQTQSSLLQYVQLRSDDVSSTLLEAATYSERIGCSYNYVSQPLSCDLTNGKDFSVVMIGEDDTGNTFQRYSTSLCSKWYICKNGGVYSNGQCLCADYFMGDECERPICQNGGTLFTDNTCSCPLGFTGLACQFVQCDAHSGVTFTNEGKALVLLLELSENMADAIDKMETSIGPSVQRMNERHHNWIDKYLVQTFTLDGTIGELTRFDDIYSLEAYINQLVGKARALPGACQMPIWMALDSLFDSPLSQYLPGSEVLIISTAVPLDADLASIYSTMEKFDIQTPIVDYLHIESPNCPVDDWSKDLRDFGNFISSTGGIVFRSTKSLIGMALSEFLPTRYAPQRLSYSDPLNCKNNDMYVQVDAGMEFVYILQGGPWTMNSIKVISPTGEEISPLFIWNSDEQCFWSFTPKSPGVYKITLNAFVDVCFPLVYGSGGSVETGRLPHAAQVFSGFIQHCNYLDTPKPYAVYGVVNFPVFYIYEKIGTQLPTETLYMARMTRQAQDGTAEDSYISDVDLRNGCSYSYVGKAFTCTKENDVITLSVSGVDSYNQPFTRQMTTYCKADGSTQKKNVIMHLLSAAILAVLACAASGAFTGEFASIFNTWSPTEDVRLVDDFDHVTQIFHPQEHEEEHTRRKRNTDETARFAAGKPITGGCNRPGYTGQYCEFPICETFNPKSNPEQFMRDEGYIVDLTDLGNCTREHKIIVDETMYDIRIEVQSLENVSPQLKVIDSQGYIGTPDRIVQEDDRFVAYFNMIDPGAYTVQPSAASIDSRCILTTTAQTTLTISGGFKTDERDRNDFPNENAGAHQFNSILLTLNGGRAPSALKTVSVVGPNNASNGYVLRPRILDKRYGCQYEFYFDSFFCYNKGSYALIVEGVDFFGNLFRRAAPFESVYQPAPPTSSVAPSTPQPTNPTSCANGGVLLESGGKTTCVCQDHWTGYDCSQALCVNGGTRIENKCFCPIGFEGKHCEQVKCEPNSNIGFGVDRPTLVIVVRARKTQNSVLVQVQKAIDEVVANLQFDVAYLSRFHLVIFNNHKIILNKKYGSIKDFDWDFELRATQSTDNLGVCSDGVLAAVAAALMEELTQGSSVYVITDAVADDYSAEIEGIIQMNSLWRATINFIVTHPGPNSKCQIDLTDPGFRAYDDVANRFGGIAYYIENRDNVYSVLYGHMNSIMYKSQMMLTLDREECRKGLGKVIQLENTAETIVFISKGRDFHLDLTSPDGMSVKPRTVVKEGTFNVMRWSTPLAGTYLVRASSDSPSAACSLRAYQASIQQLSSNTQTEVAWAMTTDVDTDAMMTQPLAGMDNHPVFHIEDFGDDVDHAFAFLNIYAVRDGVEKEVYASNGLYRGGCSFQFYFPSFRCRPNENLHYEFNLRNEQGFYIQRAGVMTCFNYIPTPAAPTECQNGGVKYNGTCLCVAHYEGEHCQNLICENGGTPFFGTCQCPTGWTGPFCIYPQCSESGPLPSFGYHADMAFIVEVTPKGVEQIKQLVTMLPEIIRDVQSQHVEWIERLVLIGYDSNGVVGMIDSPITNTNKFFDTLSAWADSHPEETMQCRVQIWQAIDWLLNNRKDGDKKRELPQRSIVNIVMASLPAYDNSDVPLVYSTSELLLERRAISNVFLSKDWNAENGFPCGGKDEDFTYLEQVARRGDGMIYTLGNGDLGRAVRMIPTLFSSSIVYKYHNDECASQVNVYFPVDAYTQTITAIVYGTEAAIDLRRQGGKSFPDEGRIDILDDDQNVVVEYRNPCDSDWEPVSQSCMYYSKTLEKSFDDASALCQSMGAIMADDLSNAKNNWLSFVLGGKQGWLGLVYRDGDWVFLEENGQTTKPPKNFNKWITGQPPADDSKGACAYTYNGLWYPMTCDREYVVICQKHMYNHQNLPSSLGDDDLSPDHYYLVVQTDLNAKYRGCDVEIRVQSDLNVEFGFVDGLRRDSPHPIASVDSNDNRVVSSVSIGKAKAQSAVLEHVMLRTDDSSSTLLEAATYSYRLGCSYEFVSQPLNCDLTNGSDFSVVMIGEDDTGNTFQRYSTSLCSKWYDCKNGGVYSNGQCLCADYFAGDNCETPLCQNGGKLQPSGTECSCPSGYSGGACQFVHCDKNSKTRFTDDGKALVFIIEKSANTATAIQNIGYYFHQLVQYMWDRHQGWVDKYMVMTFTLDGTVEELDVYYDPEQFSQYLFSLAEEAKALPGACQMPIWNAFDKLFDSPLSEYLPGSEVLLVSSAVPIDVGLDAIHKTMEKFDIQTPIVDFYHVEVNDCVVEDWLKELGNFANFLSTTGGVVFRAWAVSIGESLLNFVPTRYAPQRLSYSDPLNCKNNAIYVQVETGMSLVYVMVGSPGAKMVVETPRGDHIIETALLWNSEEQNMWELAPKYPGIYKITINSDSEACFPMIFGSGRSVTTGGGHAAQVFSGFIQNYNYIDTPKPYAVYGAVNFPVFFIYELEGHQLPTETLYTARMSRTSINGKVEESYTSDVDPREGCSYSYIGKAFTCVEESDVITLSVSGVDAHNQPFTRQTTTYCKADGPTKARLTNMNITSTRI